MVEDLVPFLIFIVIAVVNGLKFLSERQRKNATDSSAPAEEGGGRPPRAIDALLEAFAPKPTELPDWPEGLERPDYVHQKDGVRLHPVERVCEEPDLDPALPVFQPINDPVHEEIKGQNSGVPLPPQEQILTSVFSGPAMRLPAMPALSNANAGRINFELRNRKNLKQAILANMVFGQSRAYDCSFDTTLAK